MKDKPLDEKAFNEFLEVAFQSSKNTKKFICLPRGHAKTHVSQYTGGIMKYIQEMQKDDGLELVRELFEEIGQD